MSEEKKLDRPAKVGNAVFGAGVSERSLIEYAQRAYFYDWEEKRKNGLICEHERIKGACSDCGDLAF